MNQLRTIVLHRPMLPRMFIVKGKTMRPTEPDMVMMPINVPYCLREVKKLNKRAWENKDIRLLP